MGRSTRGSARSTPLLENGVELDDVSLRRWTGALWLPPWWPGCAMGGSTPRTEGRGTKVRLRIPCGWATGEPLDEWLDEKLLLLWKLFERLVRLALDDVRDVAVELHDSESELPPHRGGWARGGVGTREKEASGRRVPRSRLRSGLLPLPVAYLRPPL